MQVTFLASLVNTREPADILIGSFYGIPLLSPDQTPSMEQLQTLEEQLLSQYYLHRDSLTSALLSYASIHSGAQSTKGCEEKVHYDYQLCYKTQVCLGRLRSIISQLRPREEQSGIFQLPDGSCVNYSQYSISKLSKLIGTLLNTILSLNVDAEKPPEGECLAPPRTRGEEEGGNDRSRSEGIAEDEGLEEDMQWFGQLPLLSEEECRVLFLMMCIHGTPQMHARTIALLINFGGSQKWWGKFIVKMAITLFGGKQMQVFNKERYRITRTHAHTERYRCNYYFHVLIYIFLCRALLQFSALCQHTYNTSDLLPCLLHFLQQKLSPFLPTSTSSSSTHTTSHTPHSSHKDPDHNLLQWVIMLLAHFLSSVVLPSPQCSLLVPLTIGCKPPEFIPTPAGAEQGSSSTGSSHEAGTRDVKVG